MLKKILLVVAVLIVTLLLVASTKPDSFEISRSTIILASADKIFPLINDFRNWQSWSPYEKMDPNMKKTLSGNIDSVGAIYTWDGNGKAGAGTMQIVQSVNPSLVQVKLEMTKPMSVINDINFKLQNEQNGTQVTWTMRGESSFVSKVMMVFVDMDKMVGKDFEEGLFNLKTIVENPMVQ